MNKFVLSALFIGTLIASCKKTEIVPYDKEPANHIVSYTVTNAPQPLQGVVDDADNTITVYAPYYISIDYIAPKIALEDGATLIDKNGNKIDIKEDLDPVPFDTVGYSYTVRDEKNNIRTYTLVTKITPFKDKLKMGYTVDYNYNTDKDYINDTATAEARVNSRLTLFGNLESSSKNAKLTLVSMGKNVIVPNALTVYDVARSGNFHFISTGISAQVDSGYYIIVEHQGRKDTLPSIHLTYSRPVFDWLPKTVVLGDTLTLHIPEGQGVNTGITRMYTKLDKHWFQFPGCYTPPNFPPELYDVPIEMKIVGQNRSQVQFVFPDLPKGAYMNYASAGSGMIDAASFGIFFDFSSQAWGNDILASSAAYIFEITGK